MAPPLRALLQAGTSDVHDSLDQSVAGLDLLRLADYHGFLARQLAARDGIEDWADQHCPALLRPPSVSGLLGEDLAELEQLDGGAWEGAAELAILAPFALPAGADPLGLAWAIAGSHLGNRAILVRMRKAGASAALPCRFLADGSMTAFWQRLLPRLQEPVRDAEPALVAARAVFARFEQAFAPVVRRAEAACRQAA